ncbi:chemotaxis protein CheC [Bacillus daqingensis]|uniref:Chemotaxis protein CheC n=1 Tax=Bacillus daqingensis TaxID=872396 RepID=A0ABV9NQG4_9BACI
MNYEIGAEELDFLKEAGNIGAGHAATALSTLTGRRMDMRVPSAAILPFEDIVLDDEEEAASAVLFQLSGALNGWMVFMLPDSQAERLARQMTGYAAPDSPALLQSAFAEAGNIVCGAYISAVSDLTGKVLNLSPPQQAADLKSVLIAEALSAVAPEADAALLIDACLTDDSESGGMEGSLLIVPEPDSLVALFPPAGQSDE